MQVLALRVRPVCPPCPLDTVDTAFSPSIFCVQSPSSSPSPSPSVLSEIHLEWSILYTTFAACFTSLNGGSAPLLPLHLLAYPSNHLASYYLHFYYLSDYCLLSDYLRFDYHLPAFLFSFRFLFSCVLCFFFFFFFFSLLLLCAVRLPSLLLDALFYDAISCHDLPPSCASTLV